jgi:hypothetical protein
MQNKAKFQKAKNERNSSNSNDYEQKTTNYELLKTKPNKPNFCITSKGVYSKQTQIKAKFTCSCR